MTVGLTDRSFHDLQATWQPRHPMQRVRSTSTPFDFSVFVAMTASYAFSTLTMKALDSGIIVFASPTNGVRRFALSPAFGSPGYCQPKHQGMPTWCTV
jgi:hypothetical protein